MSRSISINVEINLDDIETTSNLREERKCEWYRVVASFEESGTDCTVLTWSFEESGTGTSKIVGLSRLEVRGYEGP
jgi:hypothetical protein